MGFSWDLPDLPMEKKSRSPGDLGGAPGPRQPGGRLARAAWHSLCLALESCHVWLIYAFYMDNL